MPDDDFTILQVSPSDCGGGAEKVALDLHKAFLERGIDAWLALGARYRDTRNTVQIPNTLHRSGWARMVLGASGLSDPSAPPRLPAPLRRAARLLAEPARYRRVLAGLEDFDSPGTSHLLDLPPRLPNVIHLHNLHGSYFDVRELPQLSARVPTILTLHDAWILTGHCAHPIDCTGYLTGCLECPALDRYVPIRRDSAAQNLAIKRQALTGGTLHLATPSRWLTGLVESSGFVDGLAELRTIPNGIDTAVFSPGDKLESRLALGLPPSSLIISFAATSASSNPFKGFETLRRAIPRIAAALDGLELLLLAIGDAGPDELIGESARVRFVPFVDDPATMALYYRASDLYLHPALAESFGLTVLEAMACGTPAVTSNAGGIPEVALSGVTSVLVDPRDDAALAAGAVALTRDTARLEAFSAEGIVRAREFTLERQVAGYLSWYHELAEKRGVTL